MTGKETPLKRERTKKQPNSHEVLAQSETQAENPSWKKQPNVAAVEDREMSHVVSLFLETERERLKLLLSNEPLLLSDKPWLLSSNELLLRLSRELRLANERLLRLQAGNKRLLWLPSNELLLLRNELLLRLLACDKLLLWLLPNKLLLRLARNKLLLLRLPGDLLGQVARQSADVDST